MARKQECWTVTLEPAGTPAEAERAADRARRLVAGWIRRDCTPGGGPLSPSREGF